MENERTEIETTVGTENTAGSEGVPVTEQKTVTFDELLNQNKNYQSAFDKKISQAIATAQHKWSQQHNGTFEEIQSREHKIAEGLKALEADRAAFEREQLQASVGEELRKRGLSSDFAPYLTQRDAESCKNAIDAFERLWNASVASTVNDRMRSTPPRETTPSSGADDIANAFKNRS